MNYLKDYSIYVKYMVEGYYYIKVMYLGTNYHGLASQRNVSSIESELFLALTKKKYITNENTYRFRILDYAGRTDRGVHARGMVFGFFNSRSDFHPMEINGELPRDICVWAFQKIYDKSEITTLFEQFNSAKNLGDEEKKRSLLKSFKDPRHYALSRHYKYLLYNPNNKFNIDNLQYLLNKFVGFHEFSSFAKKDEDKLTYRSIDSIEIVQNQPFLEINFNDLPLFANLVILILCLDSSECFLPSIPFVICPSAFFCFKVLLIFFRCSSDFCTPFARLDSRGPLIFCLVSSVCVLP
jgi:tRNA pseudouridine38-40 synthase